MIYENVEKNISSIVILKYFEKSHKAVLFFTESTDWGLLHEGSDRQNVESCNRLVQFF